MTRSAPVSADAASPVPGPPASWRESFARLANRRVLLVSHELTLTGAPLILLELAQRMRSSGARIDLVSLRDHEERNPLVRRVATRARTEASRFPSSPGLGGSNVAFFAAALLAIVMPFHS